MRIKIFTIYFLFLIFPSFNFLFSQSGISENIIFQSNIFQPLKSSLFEAKNGFAKHLNNNNLQLEIGATADLYRFEINDSKYSVGADFFTFSNLRSQQNFKFPVDCIDYFFGFNINRTIIEKDNTSISSRLRISHISSHFEDGHKYQRTDTIFTPFVYSREFIDFNTILTFPISKPLILRNSLGFNYLFHSIPDDFGKFALQYGIELIYILNNYLDISVSNCVYLVRVKSRNNLNNNLVLNIKFGEINSRGLNLFFSYYDGDDFRGQYYFNKIALKSIGIRADI